MLKLKTPVEINLRRLLKAVERQLSSSLVESEENQIKLQYSLKTCQEFLKTLRVSHRQKNESISYPSEEQLHEYHRKITTLLSLCQPKTKQVAAVDSSVGVVKSTQRTLAEELYVKKTERDVREELFGKSYVASGVREQEVAVSDDQLEDIQEQVAEDMALMAEQLKLHSLKMRDLVVKDAHTLEEINQLQTTNQTKLVSETSLLKRTITSTLSFTVLIWLLLLAVFGSFVFMYMMIRWFPKR